MHVYVVHEAGHAVAACVYRIKFDHIALHRAAKPRVCPKTGLADWWAGGHIEIGASDPSVGMRAVKLTADGGPALGPDGAIILRNVENDSFFRGRIENHIVMMLCAREVTQLLVQWSGGHQKDYEDAHRLIRKWFPEAKSASARNLIFAGLRERATGLIRKHFVSVKYVARLLDTQGQLTTREVRRAVYGP